MSTVLEKTTKELCKKRVARKCSSLNKSSKKRKCSTKHSLTTWAGDSDDDNIGVEAAFEGNIATTNITKTRTSRPQRAASLKANQAISTGGDGSTDYHVRPELLYNQLVHRYTQLLQIFSF